MLEGTVYVGSISRELTRTATDVPELGGLASSAVLDVWVLLRDLVKDRFW